MTTTHPPAPTEGVTYLPPGDLTDLGLLQEVNRLFFHPRGLALEVQLTDAVDDPFLVVGVWDDRADAVTGFAPGTASPDKARSVYAMERNLPQQIDGWGEGDKATPRYSDREAPPVEVVLTGSSDDLIEIDGHLREEFAALSGWEDGDRKEDGGYVAFSDGTVLRIAYTDEGVDGIWRITPITRGTAKLDIVQCVPSDDDRDYSDKATLTGPASALRWVMLGATFHAA